MLRRNSVIRRRRIEGVARRGIFSPSPCGVQFAVAGAATAGSLNIRSNKKVARKRSKQKIDGMVALIIALSRVIAGAGMGSV
jgi:hypothetical protein